MGIHVDASPKFVTADGGVIESGDGAELIDDDDGLQWTGPHTGSEFYRCSKCGVEVLFG